jgi:hypothetical protein
MAVGGHGWPWFFQVLKFAWDSMEKGRWHRIQIKFFTWAAFGENDSVLGTIRYLFDFLFYLRKIFTHGFHPAGYIKTSLA